MKSRCVVVITASLTAASATAYAGAPPGFEIIPVDETALPAFSAVSLNNCGQIAYSFGYLDSPASEILVYDNGRIHRVTDNDVADSSPAINDFGRVTWTRGNDGFEGGDIYWTIGGTAQYVEPGQYSRINNVQHLAWSRFEGSGCKSVDCNTFLRDRRRARQVSDGMDSNQALKMNDRDELVWTRYLFCREPWTSEIVLYSGGKLHTLPATIPDPQGPDINNLGQVVWSGMGGVGRGPVELWDNGQVVQIAEWGGNPQMNDHGDIFFLRKPETEPWECWLYVHETGEIFPFADGNDRKNTDGDINNWMEIAWRWSDDDGRGVNFMRRIRTGDSEFDGDVDLRDWAEFARCMTGPRWVERTNPGLEECLCDCRFLDINHDGSVDLADVARFQNTYTGGR